MHRFSRRASHLNTKRPRDHRACTNVAQFLFQDRSRRASSNTSLRSLISAIENARFTCYRSHAPLPHADSSAGVRNSARRVAQASTGGCSTRPRPRRQASTTSVPKTRAARTTDHSRRARRVAAAPAVVVSQPHPAGPRRRGRELPKASPAFISNDRPCPRLFLYGVTRHSCPPGPRRSAVPAPAAVCGCS